MFFPRLRALARLIGSRLPIADRAGSVAVITAIAFPVLLGFAGLAIDVGSWQETAVRAQTAADQAALAAGAASLAGASLDEYTADAQGVAAANGFASTNGATVTVSSPPASGSHAGDDGDIEVVVQQQAASFFSRLFLASAPVVGAHAVVSANAGACVILLGETGTTFNVAGSGNMDLNGCDFYNNSSASNGINIVGTYSIQAEDIYLHGPAPGYKITGFGSSVTATRSLVTNATRALDPYADRTIPSYSGCTYQGSAYSTIGSNKTVNFTDTGGPTVICGNVTELGSGGTMNFSRGVYIFENSINIVGSSWIINSTNATLIFTGSSGTITMTGDASFNLTAPTLETGGDTAPTVGMAIWEASGDTGGLTFTGSSTLNVTGAVYTPNGQLTITGTGTSSCTQLVAKKVIATGDSSLQHNCSGLGLSDVGGLALIE